MNRAKRIVVLFLFAALSVTYSCTKIYAPEYESNIEAESDYVWDSSTEVVITLRGLCIGAGRGCLSIRQ